MESVCNPICQVIYCVSVKFIQVLEYLLLFHVGSASIDWNLVKQRVEELWEEFQLPIWITEFDWNHDGDIAWGDHTQHAQVVEDFYRLMFSQEVLLSHISLKL